MLRKPSFYLAVIGLVAAVLLVARLRQPTPAAPPAAPPAPAPFAQTIGARGMLEAVDENVRVATAVAGLVLAVPVKVGDRVAAGDVLFQIDDRDARALVAAQEAQLGALGAVVRQAEVTVADRRDQLERQERLRSGRVSTEDEFQRARFAAESAAAALAKARADVEATRAALTRSRVQLDLLTVRAPRDGTVLQVNTRPGEFAKPDLAEPLLLLGRIDALQLRADVDEDNAPRVQPGGRAVAFIKGERGDPIPLRFVRVEPYVVPKRSLTGESGERVDTRVLQVIFQLDRPPGRNLYVGQQMDVFLDAGPPPAKRAGEL